MELTLRHSILGRVRLHVPELRHRSLLAEATLSWLREQDGITGARINYDCASLIIEYDPVHADAMQRMLDRLSSLSLDDWEVFLCLPPQAKEIGAPGSGPDAAWPVKRPDPHPGVLVLPTVSLGVALDTLAIAASIGQGHMVTGGLITWLVRLGDWIRDLTAAGSKRAASELLEFQAKTAWIVKGGAVVQIPAAKLVVGDAVVVYSGEMIPADGEILHGTAVIDQKTITGEGLPVPQTVGDTVFAATILCEGQMTLRATRVGTETMAGQIARLVDSAPVGDTRMQNHAERFADRLVLPTLGLAVSTALLTRDFNRFLSLVIIDYGTGIRVAAPTAVLASMTNAARNGVLIKSGSHIEKLAEVDTIVFDKTGTLSHGIPHVVEVLSYEELIKPDHLLALAVAAETHLHHPVAEALREKSREMDVQPPPCDESLYRTGLGVEGCVNGYYMHVGNERFLRQSDIKVEHAGADRAAIDERGCSSLYIAVDGKLAGLVAYEDRIRPESRQVIETLYGMGIRDTIMMTGDNTAVADAVGQRLGLTRQIANMLPSDKAKVIQQLQRDGRLVAVVGDGINDSPALSFADVGVAMKHGADIAHESAGVVLMDDSLWKLVQAIELSRGAVRLIKQNYGIVAVMNTVALGLTLPGGLISPAATAVISNGSAILASLNGVRPLLRRKAKHPSASPARLSRSGIASASTAPVQSNCGTVHRHMN